MKQEFLKPKLEGERFQDHTVPLELLKDFAALQEMLVEVAKWEYRQEHPDRQRIPRHFTDGVDLHLTGVEDGSAVLVISLVFAGLFPNSNHLPYFEKARTDIVEAIASAEQRTAPRLPPNYLNYFDRIGRGLHTGESISFERPNGKATLSPETRKQLIEFAEAEEWTEETSLRVRVPEVNKGKSSFFMELSDGTRLNATLSDPYRDVILDAFGRYGNNQDEYVLMQGVVKKDRKDRIKGIDSIEHATPIDPLDIQMRLDSLARLENGWLDGKGLAPSKEKLEWLADAFDANFDSDLPLPYLYPTAEGGVQAEWSLNDWAVTLEIDLEKEQGEYQALNLKDQTCTDLAIALTERDGWTQLNQALKQLESQQAEASQSEA